MATSTRRRQAHIEGEATVSKRARKKRDRKKNTTNHGKRPHS
ncbi:MAG TPA: hypothetical protein VHH34_06570 [Pseudonocardiaceae bacterium]|nr:hypothetical protein [Pseudonocardiaceae bacterium]